MVRTEHHREARGQPIPVSRAAEGLVRIADRICELRLGVACHAALGRVAVGQLFEGLPHRGVVTELPGCNGPGEERLVGEGTRCRDARGRRRDVTVRIQQGDRELARSARYETPRRRQGEAHAGG